jgi:hypothetical protein
MALIAQSKQSPHTWEKNTRNEKSVGLIMDPHIPKPRDYTMLVSITFGCHHMHDMAPVQ